MTSTGKAMDPAMRKDQVTPAPMTEPLPKHYLAMYGAFALSMLGLGFRLGWRREVKKHSSSDSLLLSERKGIAKSTPRPKITVKPSAPPTVLAARALGIATVICLSSASIVSLGVAWYMEISSFQQFSDRMKVMVPEHSQSLQRKLGPSLDYMKTFVEKPFAALEPILVKGRNDNHPRMPADERKVLEDAGLAFLIGEDPPAEGSKNLDVLSTKK